MSKIEVRREGHVFLIGLNRPEKYNALDPETYFGLAAAYGELHNDPDLRCGVLYANGKHFTTGLELDKFSGNFSKGKRAGFPDGSIDFLGMDEVRRVSKPIVVAIQGSCYTVGIEIVLACDIRIAADNAKFHQIEVQRGIFPVGGSTVRMFQEIGWGNAMRYILTGDPMTAEEAYRMGMVQEVVPLGQQVDKAVEIAQRIAKQAPLGVQAALHSSRYARTYGIQPALDRLYLDIMPIMNSEDAAEGVKSFLEKREAVYKGK